MDACMNATLKVEKMRFFYEIYIWINIYAIPKHLTPMAERRLGPI